MGNIVLLDDLTINKIAAGEVIERPASVVKEMVENSIDAGADKITVEIRNGGISYIRVTDNGKGIEQDDMEIAFERHATSKIRNADDIMRITSMGFRGEALASIAAIAHVEMLSRTKDSNIGHKIVVEGGNTVEQSETGCPVGTTITVTNLFFNTPVRYKFLKKDFTESGYIEDAITRLALVNRNISFKLINNNKTVIQTNGDGERKSVIYSIFGKDVADAILDVDYEFEGMKITGVVGKPEISRSNRSSQLFFVNGRYIKDKTLSAAADQAFKGMIPINKYGFLVLNLSINPELVDVNVHPAKLEVRFEEENKVFKAMFHAIKSGLAKGELIENVSKEPSSTQEITFNKSSILEEEKHEKHESLFNTAKHSFKNMFSKKEEKEEENEFDDSTKDENGEKENLLEEIYKFRNGLKELGISEVTSPANYDINKLIEESVKNKENEKLNEVASDEKTEEDNLDSNDSLEETKRIDITEIAEKEKSQEEVFASQNIVKEEEENFETSIPTEKDVFAMTAKLMSQRNNKLDGEVKENQEEDKENLAENANIEQNIEEKEEPKPDFNDMYKRIFGESVAKIDDETARKELTENERSILDDIKKKVLKDENIENDENNENNEASDVNKENENKEESENQSSQVENKEENITENLEETEEQKYVTTPQNNLAIMDFVLNKGESEKLPEFKDMESGDYKFIGIVFSTYVIIEFHGEMFIIDQHAAHERIMYEKVKKNYYSETDKDSQLMLMPDVISLSHKEAMLVKENLSLFEKAGFTLEAFGENTIKLTGVPNICMDMNTKQLFLELVDEIGTYSRTALQEREDRFIATIACKAAVKANMKLDEIEVKKLMDELLKLPNPFTCPHGRPTAIKYTKYDLERKFSRK